MDTGMSDLAYFSHRSWDAEDRPLGWQDEEFGLIVHTTGSGLPRRARRNGLEPLEQGERWYSQSHGCHYLLGNGGYLAGDLLQMANEREQANGVGTSKQRASILSGRGHWMRDLPTHLVKQWCDRWPGYSNPLDLLPGTKTANPAYIHLECIPLTGAARRDGYEPAFDGSYFTAAQYETIAALAVDLSLRKRWPDEWWRTPRLLGHEDLSPLTRHKGPGGWDPGSMWTPKPRFKWAPVMEEIGAILGIVDINKDKLPPEPGRRSRYSRF